MEQQSALGPYHGRSEGNARLLAWLAAITAGLVVAMPWSGAAYVASRRHMSLASALRFTEQLPPFRLAAADFLIVLAGVSAALLFQRLSRRIASGGPDADFLDGVRTALSSLLIVAAMALLELAVR